MSNSSSNANRVVTVRDGHNIYEHTQIKISLHHTIYLPLLEQARKFNLDISSLVKMRMGPCPCCGNDKIEIPLNRIPCARRPFTHHTRRKKDEGQSNQADTKA